MSVAAAEEGGPEGAWAAILLRRVSGRPGAEGAPLEGRGREIGISWRVVVLVVEVRWLVGGAILRDCLLSVYYQGWMVLISLRARCWW